jgi:hypothetical protein
LIAVTKHNHPFDWFKLADYAAPLSLTDWAIMLSRRAGRREILLTIYPDGVPEKDKASVWDDYLTAVSLRNVSNLAVHPSGSDHESTTPPPLIEDLTVKCSKGRRPISKFEMHIFGTRVLAVNPNAPDPVLKTHFENWLKEQRKRSPVPARRRGKPSANFEIRGDHIKSWTHYNVLAVFDLDFYAKVFGIKRLTHEQLGNLLECSDDYDPKEWGRNARAKAAEAMRCLDVLAAQIQAKTSVREGGPK